MNSLPTDLAVDAIKALRSLSAACDRVFADRSFAVNDGMIEAGQAQDLAVLVEARCEAKRVLAAIHRVRPIPSTLEITHG